MFKTPYYETVKLQIRLISLDYYECYLRKGRNFVCRISVPIDFKNGVLIDLVRLKADYE